MSFFLDIFFSVCFCPNPFSWIFDRERRRKLRKMKMMMMKSSSSSSSSSMSISSSSSLSSSMFMLLLLIVLHISSITCFTTTTTTIKTTAMTTTSSSSSLKQRKIVPSVSFSSFCLYERLVGKDKVDENNSDDDENTDDENVQTLFRTTIHQQQQQHRQQQHRRSFLLQTFAITPMIMSGMKEVVHARGLVQFPCTKPLLNVYHFMRSGTTLLEEEDIWSTNPLFLTNREAALSERGINEVQIACGQLERANINPSVIKYSLAASAMDTAGLVRDELKVGQNRVVPEFTFMDPRAIGRWDMMSYSQTLPAIIAMDDTEAGDDGTGGRPPPNDDGTPHETLADQAIRLRQLMSILETQYSGDNILLVFPDGIGPALLSAMIAGIPYNKVHVLDFTPGELRINVTRENVLQLYEERKSSRQGQGEYILGTRTNVENDNDISSSTTTTATKSSKVTSSSLSLSSSSSYDEVIEYGKLELQRLRSLNVDTIVNKKDIKIERERMEIDLQQQQRETERLAYEERNKMERLKRQNDVQRRRRRRQNQNSNDDDNNNNNNDDNDNIALSALGTGVAVFAAIPLALAGRNDDDGDEKGNMASSNTDTTNSTSVTTLNDDNNNVGSAITDENPFSMDTEELNISQQALLSSVQSNGTNRPVPLTVEEREEAAEIAMKQYLDQDDGGDAWLNAINDIVEETTEEEEIEEEDSII